MPPGVGAVPLNINGGTRVGPGGAYLQPAMDRTNLTLLTNTRVGRIRIVNGRAVGVECVGPDGAVDLTADRIVLSAGAIGSAHLLMLSGVGPKETLRSAGVPVHVDLPVGVASVDHPEWVVPVDWSATHDLPPLEAVLTTDDGIEIRPYTAGFGAMISGRRDDPADRPHLGVALMQPRSRGRVGLASADPEASPVIEHRYDSEPDDVAALRAGTELAREIAADSEDRRPLMVDVAAPVRHRANGRRRRSRCRRRRAVSRSGRRGTMGGRRLGASRDHQPRSARHAS